MKDLFLEIQHPLSYSKFEMFEQCGTKYDVVNVSQLYKDNQKHTKAYAGQDEHKELELYCKGQLAAEDVKLIKDYLPIADRIIALPGEHYYEERVAIDKQLNMTDWFRGKDIWLRIAIDVLVINGNQAVVIDWKTGKKRDELEFQMELYAFSVFVQYPQIDSVRSILYYLKESPAPVKVERRYSRDDYQRIYDKIFSKTDEIYESIASKSFRSNPTFLCNYCPYIDCTAGANKRK
jgi:hypothetical protein